MNYFGEDELKCSCCGQYKFDPETLKKLNNLRHHLGFPLIVSSGYRCEEKNIAIGATQAHATGRAVDILIDREHAYKLISKASSFGFTGIGVSQKGTGRFIHLDDLPKTDSRLRPTIWSY